MSVFQKIKSHGIAHSTEILVNRLVPAWIFRFSMGVVYELDIVKLGEVFNQAAVDRHVLQRVEEPLELQKLRELTWNSVPQETSRNHFGYRISRLLDPPSTIGGVWGGIERFNEADLGFEIKLAPDQAWIYCAFVANDARGEGVYKHLLAFAVGDLHARGYTRPRVIVQPWNKASTHVHRKYSAGTLGRIIALRIFGLAAIFCTGGITKDKAWTTSLLANPVIIAVP